MAHELKAKSGDWRRAIPFGIGSTKPKHFRDMLKVAWENRDNLGHAWKVLSKGVCDGCALGVSGFHDWTIDGVHLCMTRLNLLRLNTMPGFDPEILKDVGSLRKLNNRELRELGRIPFPMLRRKGESGFSRISWGDAIGMVAAKIREVSPEEIAFFITSRGITNEVYYVAQKVARFLGTNNVDNAARLCHSPSTGAMKHALGVAASTCSYIDWFESDLIIFFGANPANDQPVTTKYLHEAKLKGAKVVMVNPYFEPGMERYWVPSTVSSALFGTDIADHWYPVSQGGDIAFLCGVIKHILDNGWHDRKWVEDHTRDFEELRNMAEQRSWDSLEAAAGLSRESMLEFARLIAGADKAVLVWSMGITQHTYGADAVSMILNLGLLKGFVGRDGCGLMPIRGHSGVQGGAEMGAYSTALPGGLPLDAGNRSRFGEMYGFEIPEKPGLTAVEMVDAAADGKLGLLYCVGGNFLRTLPAPGSVEAAMKRVPLRVHQDIILTDQMFIEAEEAVLLLPARTRYEQEGGGTETTTERRILFTPEIPRDIGEARSEWRILRDIAKAVAPERFDGFGCDSGDEIREEIAKAVPIYAGIEKLTKAGDSIQYGGRHLCADGKFQTLDGRARFRAVDVPNAVETAAGDGEFILSTRRGKQFNTLIYADIDPLNGAPREAVLMNDKDVAGAGLIDGERVRVANEFGTLDCKVFVAPIARGNVQVHWPEGNDLLPRNLRDRMGGVPDYNARVRIEKLAVSANGGANVG